jgi:hypothetical protein
MGKHDSQRAAYEFLLEHLLSGKPFKLAEFLAVTGWKKPGTYRTYLQKQYRGLIENVEGGSFRISTTGQYRVTESFRKLVEWPKFRQHVTQVRPVGGDYDYGSSSVLIYDFLMPLTHETSLRTTLDALFFKETLLVKLRTINSVDLEAHFSRLTSESDDDYFSRVLSFIEDRFVGYSISHVDGRFRSVGILDYDDAAALYKRGRRYLIDETTAVTRFIFPYETNEEVKTIRFLFQQLFVKSMVQLVEGEGQIWMLENGPERLVHIWRAPSDPEAEFDEEEE